MSNVKFKTDLKHTDNILDFVSQSKGLKVQQFDGSVAQVLQEIDNKLFSFQTAEVADVIPRIDNDGKGFIQINFTSASKVLFTETLVGFKPVETLGLDMSRLPKVVTTPDLQSVFDAIEESMSTDGAEHEAEILKKVYLAILMGGERVGFRLPNERKWLSRLLGSGPRLRASA